MRSQRHPYQHPVHSARISSLSSAPCPLRAHHITAPRHQQLRCEREAHAGIDKRRHQPALRFQPATVGVGARDARFPLTAAGALETWPQLVSARRAGARACRCPQRPHFQQPYPWQAVGPAASPSWRTAASIPFALTVSHRMASGLLWVSAKGSVCKYAWCVKHGSARARWQRYLSTTFG